MSPDLVRDVAIVGAGPVGLFAAFALGQIGLSCAIVDALPDPGGQLAALYPEKPIYDIPGRPEIRADALVADLLAQAAPYAPAILTGESAEALAGSPETGFALVTGRGRTIGARAVIVAAGAGAFGPNRPPIAGIEAYEGRSVFYHVASRERFRDARVVIAGGGDSAVDWALSLAEVAASVTVVHRRDAFRAHEASVAAMRANPRIALAIPYQLAGLEGTDGALAAVRIARIGGGEELLPADALVALFGLSTDLGPLASWAIGAGAKTIPVDPATCETARPGVFAIGDVAAYPGKLKLILTGFAEAAAAAHGVRARLYPDRAFAFEHSTTRGAPTPAPPVAIRSA